MSSDKLAQGLLVWHQCEPGIAILQLLHGALHHKQVTQRGPLVLPAVVCLHSRSRSSALREYSCTRFLILQQHPVHALMHTSADVLTFSVNAFIGTAPPEGL